MRRIIAGAEDLRVSLRRHPVFLWVLALVVAAVFARLGVWQMERAGEKRSMLARSAAALATRVAHPAAVAADPRRAGEYDWVAVRGRFTDAPTVWLDNQQRDGVVGVRAYRVFAPRDGVPLLVDLGWTALPPDRTLPAQVPGLARAALAGLLLPPPGRGLDVGGPALQRDGTLLATGIDLAALRATLRLPDLAPRVLRPDPDPALGFARDFDILPNTLPPERHLGYAVQWFALAAAVLGTALLLTWRARRAATSASRNDRRPR